MSFRSLERMAAGSFGIIGWWFRGRFAPDSPGRSRHRPWTRPRAEIEMLQFATSLDGVEWQDFGLVIDVTKLSDNGVAGCAGAKVRLAAQDFSSDGKTADFGFSTLERFQ
ncbi:beta-xylosidase [Haloferula luteola]|uniref:Beta-xylosidase n=1 Tax=Haloferula luteola TaxID=595692 RepID=A0A840V843_9BACT|nr:hypothetical protein [Haloferula luteola]MBB5349939.1 beta-xylosidase [Haloferula luteola]